MSASEPRIALCLIVKGSDDEAPLLDKCLASVKDHVDGIYLQLNAPKGRSISAKVRKVAEKYTLPQNIETFVWEGNYVKARQANFAQVSKDYDFILWLDSDDTVENPEKIRDACAIMPKNTHGIYVLYEYEHDEYGNVTVAHWPMRIVRNNGAFVWKSSFDDDEISVHETLVQNRVVNKAFSEEFKVVHHSDGERRNRSLIRNLSLLEEMYERHRQRPDPRIVFYYGIHCYDALQYERTKQLMIEYLQLSGWAEERSEAHVFIGKIFKNVERNKRAAKTAFLMALGENPTNLNAFLQLGKLDLEESRYADAVEWLKMATKEQQGPHARELFSGQFELYVALAEALANLGGKNLAEALKWAEKALKLRPLDPEAQEQRDKVQSLVDYQKDMRSAARLIRRLRQDDEIGKIMPLVNNLPKILEDSPVVTGARLEFAKPKKWPKKSMAIYCGGSPLGIWGPWSLKDGIGGSEEAVIRLSRELTALGWHVVVYATPGERAGDYDGIVWKQYWEFNPFDEFDVLVGWRIPGLFDTQFKARKKYLWLHDVMELPEFIPERLANLDKVIVLSKYHRSLFPVIPDDKIFLSANGISPEDFIAEDGKYQRDPHRIIYMSSHIRGLALLYDIWPDVKKAVPQATLDIYYGWESYVNMNKDNPSNQPGGMAWMRMMQDWEKKLDGVTDHGKIGQKEIVREIFKSGVWAYPCPFPEIYCITAIKAQAGGAIPVSSDFAALAETVQYGTRIHMTAQDENTPVVHWDKDNVLKYKKALIHMLKHPEKQEKIRKDMMSWARRVPTWASVAQQWTDEMA